MKLVCAWCGTTIDRAGYGDVLGSTTSHGMCPACSEKLACQDRGISLQRHIDSIPVPIVLVDSRHAITAINAKASAMLGRKSSQQAFGRVFDCIYSHLPGGCGRSIHCSGCAIRNAIATTFDTGEPQICVPATLTVESPDQISDAVFAITTVKRDGVVLLRIEQRPAS